MRPTFEIHDLPSGFIGASKESVISARAAAKVSICLVPGQEPLEIAELFDEYLGTLAPPAVEWACQFLGAARRAVVDRKLPAIEAMACL